MLRFMVGDACLFSTRPGLLSPRTLLKLLIVSLAAGLALVALSGCNDESPSASEPVDPIHILKQAHVRDISGALTQAYDRFERRDFAGCIACCDYILGREPDYFAASVLASCAEGAKGEDLEGKYYDFGLLMKWYCQPKEGQLVPDEEKLTYPHLSLAGTAEPEPVIPGAPESVSAGKMD